MLHGNSNALVKAWWLCKLQINDNNHTNHGNYQLRAFLVCSGTLCGRRQYTWKHVLPLYLSQLRDQKVGVMLEVRTWKLTLLLRTSTVITHKVELNEQWLGNSMKPGIILFNNPFVEPRPPKSWNFTCANLKNLQRFWKEQVICFFFYTMKSICTKMSCS